MKWVLTSYSDIAAYRAKSCWGISIIFPLEQHFFHLFFWFSPSQSHLRKRPVSCQINRHTLKVIFERIFSCTRNWYNLLHSMSFCLAVSRLHRFLSLKNSICRKSGQLHDRINSFIKGLRQKQNMTLDQPRWSYMGPLKPLWNYSPSSWKVKVLLRLHKGSLTRTFTVHCLHMPQRLFVHVAAHFNYMDSLRHM